MDKTFGGIVLSIVFAGILLRLLKGRKRCVSVENKLVVITGASSGLGEACAYAFHNAGAKVVLLARRLEELERVKNDIQAKNTMNKHTPVVMQLDLSKHESIPQIVSRIIQEHGSVDVLINNGGMSYRGEVEHTELSVDKSVMQVNYFGQVALTKAVLPSMVERGSGHILAVSSTQGKISIPYRSAYSASKHAVVAFFDCLRAEIAAKGVKVTVYNPSYIATNLSLNAITQDGKQYGVMDSSTASGMSPEKCAQEILSCVQYGVSEINSMPVSHKAALYIRTLLPGLYFWLMQKHAKKQSEEVNKSK